MEYAVKPTKFDGVVFRARLEAKWAAFFNLCGWRWEYEPFDFDGWTPDFVLRGPTRNVLVEVKPIEWADSEWRDGLSWTDYYASSGSLHGQCRARQDLEKVSGRDVLILGAYLPVICCGLKRIYPIGARLSATGDPWRADLAFVRQDKNLTGYLQGLNSAPWFDERRSSYDEVDDSGEIVRSHIGNMPSSLDRRATGAELAAGWKEAGVKVQWRPVFDV